MLPNSIYYVHYLTATFRVVPMPVPKGKFTYWTMQENKYQSNSSFIDKYRSLTINSNKGRFSFSVFANNFFTELIQCMTQEWFNNDPGVTFVSRNYEDSFSPDCKPEADNQKHRKHTARTAKQSHYNTSTRSRSDI